MYYFRAKIRKNFAFSEIFYIFVTQKHEKLIINF